MIERIQHDYNDVVPHIYTVRIKGLADREKLREHLLTRGIQTGVHYQPNHWLAFYHRDTNIKLSVTDEIYPELLSLPLHPDLEECDIHRIAHDLIQVIALGEGGYGHVKPLTAS